MTRFDYSPYLAPALFAAKEAGDAILEVYHSDFAVEVKDDRSPLTMADKRSHEVIAEILSLFPACRLPVLSEEGRAIPYEERRTWKYFWLIDPLDGTKEFVKRNGEFTVNIALIDKDSPILGVIYIPVKGAFYFGAKGLGAFKLSGGRKVGMPGDKAENDGLSRLVEVLIQDSSPLPLKHPAAQPFTVVGSRSHMSHETSEYIEALKSEHGEVEIVSAGSSLKFCLVAEGKADVYPRFAPTMEWDTAAGQIIVEASGGEVLKWGEEGALRYNKENLLNPWFVVRGHSTEDR